MRKILLSGFAILAFFLIVNYASALGISPAKITIDFIPNEEMYFDGEINNTLNETVEVDVYKEGDLADYITFLAPDYTVIEPYGSSRFEFTVNLPGSYDEVEGKTAIIWAAEHLESENVTNDTVKVKVGMKIEIKGPPEPTLSLSANPSEIAKGDSTTLSWSSSGLSKCAVSSNPFNSEWNQPTGLSGSRTIHNLEETTTFTIVCFNLLDNDEPDPSTYVTRHATVTVKESTCYDSDGGKNYYVKGYVTYEGHMINGELVKEYDKCVGNILQEKYCVPDGIGTIDYRCSGSCKDGACVEEREGCPSKIDMDFNKEVYYPGDYFEVVIVVYDENGNPIPNQAFNVYNDREGSTVTYYTDSSGYYKTSSTLPSDPELHGEWTFLASVNEENCPYISDKETIYIEITTECGDGFCDENEKEIVCDNVCTETLVGYEKIATGVTGAMTTVSGQPGYTVMTEKIPTQPTYCEVYCHVKCSKDCTPNCGNGVCDKEVCEREGCPVPENERNCPQDCKQANYCGSKSSDPTCICQPGYRKERFQVPCGDIPEPPIKEVDSSVPTGMVTGGELREQVKCVFENSNSEQECYSADSEGGRFSCSGIETCVVDVYGTIGERITWKSTCGGYDYSVVDGENEYVDFECSFQLRCAKEGEYTSGAVSPEYQYGCCEDLKGFNTNPNVVGRGLLCYDPEKGIPVCKHDGTRSEGWYYSGTGELLRYEDCHRETEMCIYYRCVPSHKYMYLSTDKYAYNINEPVTIQTNHFETGDLELEEIKVSVKNPYGDTEEVTLKHVCEQGGPEICPTCVPGDYCPPCKAYNFCRYEGTFTGTDTIGVYDVSPSSEMEDYVIHPTSFRVYDYSLLGKYLILENIDGYTYKDAQLSPGPENVMGYMATYVKDGREYAVVVGDFRTREDLEKFLTTTLGQYPTDEERVDGYYIYVAKSYGQKVYFWTYKTFFIGVLEHSAIAVPAGVGKAVPVTAPQEVPTMADVPLREQEVLGTPQKAPGFMTGMITGMPGAIGTELKYCGMDSLDPNCVCGGDETKEEFPVCGEGGKLTDEAAQSACRMHYRCKKPRPKELLIAYLDKYPSDIKATGTQCEQKGGYCIDVESSCRSGSEQVSFSCKTSAEKCCIQEVDRADFLEMVMKLEGIRVKMDKLERQARALAEYYDSVGDDERANKFREVADMFATVKEMIDDIIAKIRDNLNDLDAIRNEVKEDIQELRIYISSILEEMVS